MDAKTWIEAVNANKQMVAELGGETFTLLSDGPWLLAIVGEHGVEEKKPVGLLKVASSLYSQHPEDVAPVDLNALKEWAGKPPLTAAERAKVDCRNCKGTGEVECWECGHESDCKHCGGTGSVGLPDDEDGLGHGRVLGLVVQRKYVATVLRGATGHAWIGRVPTSRSMVPGDEFIALGIFGDGWWAIVCEVLGRKDDVPTFECAPLEFATA